MIPPEPRLPDDDRTQALGAGRHEAETREDPARPIGQPLAPPRMESLGNRFEVLALLGRGGMGEVYRALDLTAGRDVALKLTRERILDPDRLMRFHREGEITAALDHPGIVRVYSAGVSDGRP